MVITRRVHYFTNKKNGGLMNVHYSIITIIIIIIRMLYVRQDGCRLLSSLLFF